MNEFDFEAALYFNDSLFGSLENASPNACMLYKSVEHARIVAKSFLYVPGQRYGMRALYIIKLKARK